jgi:hypothetical protein
VSGSTNKFFSTKIYNFNESGLSSRPKSQSTVISLSGRRQVGYLTSAEREQLITTVLSFSAVRHYVPPFFIFPGQRMKDELLDGSPPGT